jgi:general secretion pathway protein F
MTTAAGWSYRALKRDGTVADGTLDAASREEAVAALARQEMIAIDVHLAEAARDRRARLAAADLSLGLRLLAELLETGLPITRALQTLAELAPAGWRDVLPHLSRSVKEGKSLGAALRDAPADIPPLVVGMVLAGETAGDVAGAVRRAADVTESQAETRAAVRAALAYPLVLALAGAGTIALMIGVVIPRFAVILADLGQALPPTTRAVLAAADATRAALLPAGVAAALIVVALRGWMSGSEGRRRVHAGLLGVPIVGSVRRGGATARATFTLASLLDTGVPLRHAIPFAAHASGDGEMEHRVRLAGGLVESGSTLAAAFTSVGALTPLAIKLVSAGEQSGRLAPMLRHAAKLEQQRADRLVRGAVRLLEPSLILLFAGIVALVAAALLQAVYAVRPTSI